MAIDDVVGLWEHKKTLHRPGIEPGSPVWKTAILTIILPTQNKSNMCFDIFILAKFLCFDSLSNLCCESFKITCKKQTNQLHKIF